MWCIRLWWVCSTLYILNCSTTTGIETIIPLIPPFRHPTTNSTMLCFWNMFSKYDDDEPSEPSLIYNLFTFRPRIFPRYNKLIPQNYEVLFTVCTLYALMNVNLWSVYHCNSLRYFIFSLFYFQSGRQVELVIFLHISTGWKFDMPDSTQESGIEKGRACWVAKQQPVPV